ncbi:MAG TPA: hypothetical protein VMP41_08355 [Acidimicrobiales bacterium]|nr:hypothetical protein [Acidimicrobiales bacterium]
MDPTTGTEVFKTLLSVAPACASRAASSGPRFGMPVLAAEELVDAPAGVVAAKPLKAINDAAGTKTSDKHAVGR